LTNLSLLVWCTTFLGHSVYYCMRVKALVVRWICGEVAKSWQ